MANGPNAYVLDDYIGLVATLILMIKQDNAGLCGVHLLGMELMIFTC